MKTLLASLIAGTFAVVSSAALAQAPAPATPRPAGPAISGAEQTQAEKSKEAMDNAAKSKAGGTRVTPTVRGPEAQKALQDLNRSSTNPAQAKAAVEESKKTARQKPKNVKDMTMEERNAIRKQTAEQSKP